jgi:outer membrane cobalamin receptor
LPAQGQINELIVSLLWLEVGPIQQPSPQGDSAEAGDTLQELVVTAERRVEDVQKKAASVSGVPRA